MSAMNLTRLEYFLAVTVAGTVTAAAARLRVAQPAVSRQLAQLEQELGMPLFARNGRRLELTAAGRDLVPLAREFLNRAADFEHATRDLAAGVVSHLVLAAPETTVTEIVAPFLATLSAEEDPLIRVLHEPPHDVHEALRRGADLVISTEAPRASLAWLPLPAVPLRAYVAADHPWALELRAAVTPAELVAQKLLLLPGNYMTRKILDQAVIGAGLAYGSVEECPVSRVIQALAQAGFGVGVLTDHARFGVHTLPVVTADDRPLRLHLHAAWDPGHHAAPLLESLARRMARHT
jgi:DNA-binding transcriptional LysR family regulator